MFQENLFSPPKNRLHCMISPRNHHIQTLRRHQSQNLYKFDFSLNEKISKYQHKIKQDKISKIRTDKLRVASERTITQFAKPFDIFIHRKSIDLTRNQSYSTSSQNKFYAFKAIKEEQCRQKNEEGKVIKSIKMFLENPKKKIIEHLDQIQTIQSKNSPRQSLNFQFEPQIEESQIIMRGGNLYDDLLKENQIHNSTLFSRNTQSKIVYQTPATRKQLKQSFCFLNRNNIRNQNAYTEPKKVFPSLEQTSPSPYKNRYFPKNENQMILNNIKQYNPETYSNSLSFLKINKAK